MNELEKLRADVALAAKIIKQHQEKNLRDADDAKARSTAPGDYASQDARVSRGVASGYELALDALYQATDGQFGVEYKPAEQAAAEVDGAP